MHCIVPQRGRHRDPRSIQLGSALIRLYSRLFPKQTARDPRLIAEAVTEHTSYVLTTAERERFGQLEIVGGVTLRLPDSHEFAIIAYIGTHFQRSGYGRRLLGAVCEHMRAVNRTEDPIYTFAVRT